MTSAERGTNSPERGTKRGTLGLAIIARNEEKRLPILLKSIEGAFDQVVLVDTGSVDRTIEVFQNWVVEEYDRNNAFESKCEYFHWIKDFAAARTFAHSLLDTEWEVWADCDDVIVGAQNIRQVVAQTQENITGLVCGYNYAQHPQTGKSVCYLRRERIVRRGMSTWTNRVHEAQVVNGPVVVVPPETVEWIHQKQYQTIEELKAHDSRRNLDILDDWVKDEPNNTRVLAYLGTEYAASGDVDTAIGWFEKYLQEPPNWDEERAQVYRKVAMCHMLRGEFDTAIKLAMQAVLLMPSWTDSYLTLAESHHMKGKYDKAVEWAQEALRRGQPDTLLIINPMDYTYQPRKVLAGALAGLGKFDEAIQYGTEAFQLNPMDQGLEEALLQWRAHSKRDHTANTIAMMVQQLVAHDEQWKALTLIEQCVPHFADDHPGVVNLRSDLRARLQWVHDPRALLEHYENGGSKPEDFVPEDKIDEVAGSLPRTMFLYNGIHEQLLEAHHEGLITEAMEKQLPAALGALGGAAKSS